ncbi:VOC family protein [Halobacteria archaeon AArc-dxtr1]|nr:VOC family protein [Halobacteria archaeon AArc-dxtr1]
MVDVESPAPDTRIGRTALRVAEREEVTAFYRDVVGLTVLSREAERTVLGADGTELLVLSGGGTAAPRGRSEAGLFHTAFAVPTRADLGDALRRVRDRWRLDGAADHGFSEALYFTDPEGNGVEVYRDRPQEAWPRTDGGDLRTIQQPLGLERLAANAAGADRAPAGTTVGHVHLEGTSTAAARSFYVDALGFAVTIDLAPSALFVAAGGYHHHVAVNTWNGRSSPKTADTRGLAWFELVVPDAAALGALRERFGERDVSARDRTEGIELAAPDGISVRVRREG